MSMSLGRLEVHECREDWECSHWPPVSRRWMCRSMCKNTQRSRERRRGNEEWEEGWVSETWGGGQTVPSPPPPSPMHFLLHLLSYFNALTLAFSLLSCQTTFTSLTPTRHLCARSSHPVQLFNFCYFIWMVLIRDFHLYNHWSLIIFFL